MPVTLRERYEGGRLVVLSMEGRGLSFGIREGAMSLSASDEIRRLRVPECRGLDTHSSEGVDN